MDVGVGDQPVPVKQIIICGCEAKFQNEAELKVHLNLYHKGDLEVKVRIQKVYLGASPEKPASKNSKNGTSNKPISQKSTQNTNVQKQSTFIVPEKLDDIENQMQANVIKNPNVVTSVKNATDATVAGSAKDIKFTSKAAKSPNPIIINKKSIIPNTGKQHFAVFKTADNKFIVKNNMFHKIVSNVIPSTDSNIQVPSASKANVQATPKNVQVATTSRINVLSTPKNLLTTKKVLTHQIKEIKPVKPIILPNLGSKLSVSKANRDTVETKAENLVPMYLVSGKPPNETYQQVMVRQVNKSQESPIKEDPVHVEEMIKLEEIQVEMGNDELGTEYHVEIGDDGGEGFEQEIVQDDNEIIEEGNEFILSDDVQDTEYQSITTYIEDFQKEIIKHEDEIEVGGNEIVVPNVKCEVEIHSEDVTEEVTESENESKPKEIRQFIKAGPNIIVAKGQSSQEEFHYCDLCGKTFGRDQSLRQHKSRYHKVKVLEKVPAHMCSLCDKTFESERGLQYHKSRYHKIKGEINCSVCDGAFKSQKSLNVHQARAHGIESQTNNKQGKFQCQYCDKVVSCKISLIYHERLHTGERPYACTYCDKKFVGPANLEAKFQLLYHERRHTGERPHQCTICGKTFANPYNLEGHIRVHTNERPFSCEECGKKFKGQAALWRHRMIHTGARPYTCSICGKSFTQSNSMKLHILTVHLKQPTPYKSQSRAAKQGERQSRARRAMLPEGFKQRPAITISQIPLNPGPDGLHFDEDSLQYKEEEVYE